MFQRILVPLDGSKRAEQALPVAAKITRFSHGTLILMRAMAIHIDFPWPAIDDPYTMINLLEDERKRIREYLSALPSKSCLKEIKTVISMREGAAARMLLSEEEEQKADLIIMSSHGETGFQRWMLGSVTQKVARHSHIPVLVKREHAGIPTNMHPEGLRPVRMLVALDGSSFAESTLAPAAALSSALSAPLPGSLHLIQVLPFPESNSSLHQMAIAKKEQAVARAQSYLRTLRQHLLPVEPTDSDLHITTSISVDENVAAALIERAEDGGGDDEAPCDIIAMATHGRGGPERWIMGSVTERVLDETRLPLLIIRPQSSQ